MKNGFLNRWKSFYKILKPIQYIRRIRAGVIVPVLKPDDID